MKKILWGLMLFCVVQASAGQRAWGAEQKVVPADYNINVHVSGSAYVIDSNLTSQILTASINGKHYELQGNTYSSKSAHHGNGLIDPGDYHARLTQDIHKSSFESEQTYEFLLPDGTKRVFVVIAQSE